MLDVAASLQLLLARNFLIAQYASDGADNAESLYD